MQGSLWHRCLTQLEAELPEQQFNTWIRPLQAVEDGDVLRLLASYRFVVDWVNENADRRRDGRIHSSRSDLEHDFRRRLASGLL